MPFGSRRPSPKRSPSPVRRRKPRLLPRPQKKTPAIPGHAALIALSGAGTPGKRIELVKTVTNLGKAGKHAGAITRTPDGYLLAPGDDEAPKLNGRKLSGKKHQAA